MSNAATSNNRAKASAPVKIEALAKHYGNIKANDNVNLDIEGGEFMTLLGPSGSGKTTTLKMVAGFVTPTSGKVMIDNKAVTEPPHKRDIGMVFQNYALFPHMTAAQNVEFPLRMRRVPKQESNERVKNALAMVDLADRMGQLPRQLSGGQQQRVALARALVFEPRVVLMDEPLGALDKKLRENLQLQIRAIQQDLGITMIYVTHDQEEALVMSDRIAVFNRGKIVQVGTGEALYERPETRFVADFIGESNIFSGSLDGNKSHLKSEGFSFAVPNSSLAANGPAALVVRPERIRLNALGSDVAGSNSVNVTIKDIIYLGSERKYELERNDGTVLIARHQVGRSNINPEVGEQILASWQVEHGVVVLDED